MDLVRSASRPREPIPIKRKLRTGPLPGVPWRDLERRGDLEAQLPVLILLSFAALAAIQFMLQG